MNREVIKYKFNRNHIKIYTIHNPDKWNIHQWGSPRYDVNTSYHKTYNTDTSYIKPKTDKNYIEDFRLFTGPDFKDISVMSQICVRKDGPQFVKKEFHRRITG